MFSLVVLVSFLFLGQNTRHKQIKGKVVYFWLTANSRFNSCLEPQTWGWWKDLLWMKAAHVMTASKQSKTGGVRQELHPPRLIPTDPQLTRPLPNRAHSCWTHLWVNLLLSWCPKTQSPSKSSTPQAMRVEGDILDLNFCTSPKCIQIHQW